MAGLRYFRGKNYFTTNHFVFFIYSVLSVHQLQSIIKKKTANWQLTKCELVKFEWTFCWDFGGEIKDKRIRSHCLFRGQFSIAPWRKYLNHAIGCAKIDFLSTPPSTLRSSCHYSWISYGTKISCNYFTHPVICWLNNKLEFCSSFEVSSLSQSRALFKMTILTSIASGSLTWTYQRASVNGISSPRLIWDTPLLFLSEPMILMEDKRIDKIFLPMFFN